MIEEMLKVLPQTKWILINEGEIVTEENIECCPWIYAHNLGISVKEYRKVFDAADNKEGHDPELRKKLLEACGLI